MAKYLMKSAEAKGMFEREQPREGMSGVVMCEKYNN